MSKPPPPRQQTTAPRLGFPIEDRRTVKKFGDGFEVIVTHDPDSNIEGACRRPNQGAEWTVEFKKGGRVVLLLVGAGHAVESRIKEVGELVDALRALKTPPLPIAEQPPVTIKHKPIAP